LIREIPVQVNSMGIRSSHSACSIALGGNLIAIGIHAVQEVHPGAIDQLGYPVVVAVAFQHVFGEEQQAFLAHHLIAMHVGHVFELRHARHMGTRRGEDLQHPQFTTLDTLANAVEAGERGIAGGHVPQEAGTERINMD